LNACAVTEDVDVVDAEVPAAAIVDALTAGSLAQ